MVKTFNSEKELMQYCKGITEQRVNDYKDYITGIESNGAKVKVEFLFRRIGGYSKRISSDGRSSFMICVSIFPMQYSKDSAEKFHVCQHYYSRIGSIKKRTVGYVITENEQEDKGLTIFFKRYNKLLAEKQAKDVLISKISIALLNAVTPHRIGSSFDVSYNGFPLHVIWIIVLFFILLIIDIVLPSGYYPSIKRR